MNAPTKTFEVTIFLAVFRATSLLLRVCGGLPPTNALPTTVAAVVVTLPEMPPKAKSLVELVDGVHCTYNIASRVVVVGTGLVTNAERDTFKLKVDASLADAVRARPKFALFAAAAASAVDAAAPTDAQPLELEPKRRRLLGSEELLELEGAGPSREPPLALARELQSLSELNRSADGVALQPGWGTAEARAKDEAAAAENAARLERHESSIAARRERVLLARALGSRGFSLIQESWERLYAQHWQHYAALSKVTDAAVAAAEASVAPGDSSEEERAALAKAAGERALEAAWAAAIRPPTDRQRKYLQTCQLCFREGPAAAVAKCSDACVPLCNTGCQRRGSCPNHFGNRASWAGVSCSGEPNSEYLYRAYAEVAAGIGCGCDCCIQLFEQERCLPCDDFVHDEPSDSAQRLREKLVERALLRAALAAAGNPQCRLSQILELCDTCTGSCGVELECGGFCGEDVVQKVVQELVDVVAEA